MAPSSHIPIRLVHITTVAMSLRFLRGQLEYMHSRGVGLAAISSPGAELQSLAESGVTATLPLRMHRRLTPLRDCWSTVQLLLALRRLAPTVVHAHTPKAGLLAMIASTILRVPVRIYHMRGLPLLTSTGWRRWMLSAAERLSCTLAHRVICVSPSLRATAIDESLVAAEKAVVFGCGSGNGVDAQSRYNPDSYPDAERQRMRAALEIPEAVPVVGFVGRIVRDKGIPELASAWSMVRDGHPSARLLLIGPVEQNDPVSPAVLQQLREDPSVVLVQELREAAPYYSIMDLVVLPSHREGFPNVPLEAAAMGLPVVTTDAVGCIDAVVDDVTGTIVPRGSTTELASAITRYLTDSDLRRRHGVAGRARVLRDFAPERIWESTLVLYRSLLAARG